jgi:outer membrane lipoprotein LolB
VQTEKNGGSLDIIWKQLEQEYSIRLIAPLGAGNYLIQGNDSFAEVRHPDGRKEIIDDVDKVFEEALGVSLPVTAIRDWLRGLPAKGLKVERISWNAEGLINRLKQSGWNVEMKKYTGSSILWPHAIYLNRDDNPEVDIRLALRQWLVDTE